MKDKMIKRGALGFPLGMAIGYVITILVSLALAQGAYVPCSSELVSLMGSEIKAVLLQALLCGIIGAGFAAASVIWEIDSWSLLKQTGIYFLVLSAVMLPLAYFAYWMEHSAAGFLRYFGVFTLIFAVIWIVSFFTGRRNVRKMNEQLSQAKEKL